MKGIILAGGKGTRLYPSTTVTSKQLLPLYDKPMVYYPMSTLMLADIREILLISTREEVPKYKLLFGDGSHLGVRISYCVQEQPNGLAESILLGEEFIGDDSVCLVLGDNFFYGQGMTQMLRNAISHSVGATIFGCPVKNASQFGVVEFDEDGKALSIEEKPKNARSHYAIPGIYFYDNRVISIAKSIKPSTRGELEISSVNQVYLDRGALNVELFGKGITWLDTGTPASILKASCFVESVQDNTGYYIACLEEVAWRRGFITKEQMLELGESLKMTEYGQYILSYQQEELREY